MSLMESLSRVGPARRVASVLMLLSGLTPTARYLLTDPSASNTPLIAAFGVACFLAGLLLLRPGSAGLWLGSLLGGIGALVGGLIVLTAPSAFAVLPAINAAASVFCFVLLVRNRDVSIPWRIVQAFALVAAVLVGSGAILLQLMAAGMPDPYAPAYAANCAVCHGENLEGLALGPALVGRDLVHGSTVSEITESIAVGFPASGMPGWSDTLDEAAIQGLSIMIAEARSDYDMSEFNVATPLVVPDETIRSERHDFRVETVASGLHALPYSIAPLPDGRILVTEKTQGLRIVSKEGELSPLVHGTPPAHSGGVRLPPQYLVQATGWMMDVAIHPEYEQNGWVYLHFGDRCSDCSTSMNKLIRGRIVDGRWTDQETIWEAHPDTYSGGSDMGRGGRISFDRSGHVFLSVGIKGNSNYLGIQDLSLPHGKIHRVHDDGRIPEDNPFVDVADALPSTWTYGHRSPQGLEFDTTTGRLWSTEMGPRGGDELNLLLPGRNYGWPLTSKGLDYDGTPVEYGEQLGIELDLSTIEQPVLDMTPSPAISSFAIYRGESFPEWEHDVIAGTLKATELYRWKLDGDRVVHRETLLSGIGRIRDVEVGSDGAVYLLLEHDKGGRIVKLVPVTAEGTGQALR